MGKSSSSPSSSWLSAVKRAFRSPSSKDSFDKRSCPSEDLEQQEQQKKRGKRRWLFGKPLMMMSKSNNDEKSMSKPNKHNSIENVISMAEDDEEEQKNHAITVAIATAAAAEAAVATAQAAVELIRLTRPGVLARENHAATTIQKAFKGYLARRALKALKGVVLMQALIRGHNVRKRTELTVLRMQALIRVQTQVCYQRRRHSVSNEGSFSSSSFTSKIPVEENQSVMRDIDSISMSSMKNKEDPWKCERDLAHAFSHKIWRSQREDHSDSEQQSVESHSRGEWRGARNHRESQRQIRPGRYSCDEHQRTPIKIVRVDNSTSYFLTPERRAEFNPYPNLETPIRPTLQKLDLTNFLSCQTMPSYMAETESSTRARARVRARVSARSQSVPRQQIQLPPCTPERDRAGNPRRRLLFRGANEVASSLSCTSTPRFQKR